MSKADALAFLRATESAIDRARYVDPSLARTLLGDYVATSFLPTKAGVSERTRINIEGRLRNHILPACESAPVGSFQPSDVRAFVASLTAKGLAPSTVKAIYLVLAQVFDTAAVDGYIARTPCVGIKLPSDRGREEMLFLEPAPVDALAEPSTTGTGRSFTSPRTAACALARSPRSR